jgi:hypothetical protein
MEYFIFDPVLGYNIYYKYYSINAILIILSTFIIFLYDLYTGNLHLKASGFGEIILWNSLIIHDERNHEREGVCISDTKSCWFT